MAAASEPLLEEKKMHDLFGILDKCRRDIFVENIGRLLSFPLSKQIVDRSGVPPPGLLCFYCYQSGNDIYCCGLYNVTCFVSEDLNYTELCALGKFSVGDWDEMATFFQKTLDKYHLTEKYNYWMVIFDSKIDFSLFRFKGKIVSDIDSSVNGRSADLVALDKIFIDSTACRRFKVISTLVTNKDECLFCPINKLFNEAEAYNEDRSKPVGGYLKSFVQCLLNVNGVEKEGKTPGADGCSVS